MASLVALLLWVLPLLVAGTDNMTKNMTKVMPASVRTKLAHELSALRKQAVHEMGYAHEDGAREVDFFREEYQRKERNLVKAFEKRYGKLPTPKSDAEQKHGKSRSNPMPQSKSHESNAEQKHGTPNSSETLSTAPDTGVSPMLFLGDDSMSASDLERELNGEGKWEDKLSNESHRAFHKQLSHLDKENRVQMKWAREYGKQVAVAQQKDYESKVARIVAEFKGKFVQGNSTGNSTGLLAVGTYWEGSPKFLGLCAAAMSGMVVTTAYLKRSMFMRSRLAEPLLVGMP